MDADLTISTSIRAKILQALGDRARELIVLLPSGMDATAKLTWARREVDPSELPVVNIIPEVEMMEKKTYYHDHLTMPVEISVACTFDEEKTNPVDLAEDLLAVMRRTIPDERDFGGLIESMTYIGGGVENFPFPGQQALSCTSRWAIEYKTVANNPDQQ